MADQNRFKMPFVISVEEAASLMVQAIRAKKTETVIPWQLALIRPLWRAMPNRIFDHLAARFI